MLELVPENFVEKLSDFVSKQVDSKRRAAQRHSRTDNRRSVIVTRENLTHYEAVGLILYASDDRRNTASQIQKLLENSGIKSMVPARLNEMTKRGQVFKPDPAKPEFKLTIQGERWVEEEVLTKLRGKMS